MIRKEKIERSFADSKNNHGYRYAMYRGLEKNQNYTIIDKNITLETLKIGDIFPSYYAINSLYLDVNFEADTPCEFIAMKLSDIQEIVPDTYEFIKKYAKPYPGEEFLRKFYCVSKLF